MLSNGGISVTRSVFFKLPSSSSQFQQILTKSQLLGSLGTRKIDSNGKDSINSITSLPADIKSKKEIYKAVELDNPSASSASVKFKQSYYYLKSLMAFYKTGVGNVWKNRKIISEIRRNKYHLSGLLDNKGKDANTSLPGFGKLTKEMSQVIHFSQIENQTANKNLQGDVVKEGQVFNAIDPALFSISRQEYQLLKRTPSDFIKLPTFAAIFLVFMECTPFVCLAFPEITPSTCVLPMVLPRMWNTKASLKLYKCRENLSPDQHESAALQNAFNLPVREARLIAQTLRLTSKYIPISLYPVSILRNRLQNYYNYLKVDNYFLAGLNGENSGNIWNLTNQELIAAALERNLILDLKADMKELNSQEESSEYHSTEKYFDNLRYKLFCFIADFENFNIGYIGLTHHFYDKSDAENFRTYIDEFRI